MTNFKSMVSKSYESHSAFGQINNKCLFTLRPWWLYGPENCWDFCRLPIKSSVVYFNFENFVTGATGLNEFSFILEVLYQDACRLAALGTDNCNMVVVTYVGFDFFHFSQS